MVSIADVAARLSAISPPADAVYTPTQPKPSGLLPPTWVDVFTRPAIYGLPRRVSNRTPLVREPLIVRVGSRSRIACISLANDVADRLDGWADGRVVMVSEPLWEEDDAKNPMWTCLVETHIYVTRSTQHV